MRKTASNNASQHLKSETTQRDITNPITDWTDDQVRADSIGVNRDLNSLLTHGVRYCLSSGMPLVYLKISSAFAEFAKLMQPSLNILRNLSHLSKVTPS